MTQREKEEDEVWSSSTVAGAQSQERRTGTWRKWSGSSMDDQTQTRPNDEPVDPNCMDSDLESDLPVAGVFPFI